MIRIQMAKIAINQFAILSDDSTEKDLKINTEIKASFSEQIHRVGITLVLNFMSSDDKVMTLSVTCEFRIHDDDWKTMTETGKLIVKESDIEYFVAQTIGTARGVLYCKTEGTKYNWVVLPSVNVHEMKLGDFVADLQIQNQ